MSRRHDDQDDADSHQRGTKHVDIYYDITVAEGATVHIHCKDGAIINNYVKNGCGAIVLHGDDEEPQK